MIIRWFFFTFGLIICSLGITLTIKMQHLGVHPWEVLTLALYERFGLSIGSWGIIIGGVLISISYVLDKSYIKLGTFLNALIIGVFVDLFLKLDFLPYATHTWLDFIFIIMGIVIIGVGGGMYNAGGVGAGPRDGFMLSISDKTGISVGNVRIIIESSVLVLGLVLGGPVFVFTFIFTFIQSPIFQYSYTTFGNFVESQVLLSRQRN